MPQLASLILVIVANFRNRWIGLRKNKNNLFRSVEYAGFYKEIVDYLFGNESAYEQLLYNVNIYINLLQN